MKTLLTAIACAGLLGGCAVAPYDSAYTYSYGYDAPYSYGTYYDYGPYYYSPGYYGYYSAPVIVGGVRYYSHDRRDWRDRNWHDRADRNGHDRSGWRGDHRSDTRSVRPATSSARPAANGRFANGTTHRPIRNAVAPAQRPARGNPAPTSRAQSEVRNAS